MPATRELPLNFELIHRLDLSSRRTSLLLNLAALPLLVVFGLLFNRVIIFLRLVNPFQGSAWNVFTTFTGWHLLVLILSVLVMLILHELIHGIFFWIFTHARPRFALRSGYAFAAAPDWFLPRLQYVCVGLAPLVIISLAAILISWFAPAVTLPFLLVVATFNAAGSLGDILVAIWTMMQPSDALINDQGDSFTAYGLVS